MQVGIVGLPNVGKSTLFNALTAAGAQAANYPFCTIDPNVGVVAVPDERLDTLAEVFSPERVTPTAIEFLDIAGLVEGASAGEGLGNQFLSHIRQVDAIVHIVRCFPSADVVHVYGGIDPLRDKQVIDTELALADLQVLEKRQERVAEAGSDRPQGAGRGARGTREARFRAALGNPGPRGRSHRAPRRKPSARTVC